MIEDRLYENVSVEEMFPDDECPEDIDGGDVLEPDACIDAIKQAQQAAERRQWSEMTGLSPQR